MNPTDETPSINKHFVESSRFVNWVRANPPEWDQVLAKFEQALSNNPESGKVIKGTGGLRKTRITDPKRGKGKRGGARVIYLHVPEVDWIFLLDIYGKDQAEDLTADKRKLLAELAVEYREYALAKGRQQAEEQDL